MTDLPTGIGTDPAEIASRLAAFPDRELTALVKGPAGNDILDEVFRQIQDRFRPELAEGGDAFVRFVLTGGPADSRRTYGLLVRDGACTLSAEADTDTTKTLTITIDRVRFARVITGRANGARLYLLRQVKIDGDMKFGGRVLSWFDIQPGGGG
jgi:hypothetical protein